MRTVMETIRKSRWRWTYAGLFGSLCSIFLTPYNLAGLGPFAMWTLWILFPFGMLCRPGVVPGLLEALVWLGPPTFYGLVLSAVTGTHWWRLGWCSVLILHTVAVCFAALS